MASIEYLQERILKGEEKVAKKKGTVGKKTALIEKKKAKMFKTADEMEKRWIQFDIDNLVEDIERLTKEIAYTEEKLVEYRDSLAVEINKANSRNVKPILDFLVNWRKLVKEYYLESYDRYLKDMEKHEVKWKALEKPEDYFHFNHEKYEEKVKIQKKYNYIRDFITYQGFDTAKLDAVLERESQIRYDNLINKVVEITGTITDASGLDINQKGELDGVIIGEKGTVEVHTIGAGGYNVQCFHYRTLVTKLK